MAASMKN